MQYTWTPSKDFIKKLQLAPKIPPVVPAVPYPEEEGAYKGSRYYSTAISLTIINNFIKTYLSFLEESKEITLMGRQKEEIKVLALEITQDKKTSYDKAEAVHSWVYENIDYKRTPYIIPPWELIKPEVTGDCKSFAILVASLLGAIEIPCWFKLVKINGLEILHIYNLANLSWETIDGVGAYIYKEVKPISGYIIFEIDKTFGWPPKPLPSGGEPYIPEKLKKEILPLIGILGGAVGVISLAALKVRKK